MKIFITIVVSIPPFIYFLPLPLFLLGLEALRHESHSLLRLPELDSHITLSPLMLQINRLVALSFCHQSQHSLCHLRCTGTVASGRVWSWTVVELHTLSHEFHIQLHFLLSSSAWKRGVGHHSCCLSPSPSTRPATLRLPPAHERASHERPLSSSSTYPTHRY